MPRKTPSKAVKQKVVNSRKFKKKKKATPKRRVRKTENV